MAGDAAPERPHFCPYCGEPVGWFFGRFETDGGVWCERCQEWFRAERLDEGTSEPDRAFSDNGPTDSGVTPHEDRETHTP
jgi:hypothetical protein